MSAIYAAAFERNPAYRAIFLLQGDEQTRAFRWLFERRVRMLQNLGASFVVAVDGNGDIIGSVGMVPPACRPGILDMLMVGLLLWPYIWGIASLQRLLQLDERLVSAAVRTTSGAGAKAPPLPAWEVTMMAIKPGRQGQGLGSKLLTRLLQSTATPGSRRIKLSTQEERNVRFYEKHGFKVESESTVGEAGVDTYPPFRSWTMQLLVPPAQEQQPGAPHTYIRKGID